MEARPAAGPLRQRGAETGDSGGTAPTGGKAAVLNREAIRGAAGAIRGVPWGAERPSGFEVSIDGEESSAVPRAYAPWRAIVSPVPHCA